MKNKLKAKDLDMIFSNPFYCLGQIDSTLCLPHTPMVSEEVFINVGVNYIKEFGARAYIKNLLENLKGNFV